MSEFWKLSPKELYCCFKGYEQSMDREYNRMADMGMMIRTVQNKKTLRKTDLYKPSRSVPKITCGKKVDESVWDGVDDLVFKEYKGR